MKSALLSLSLCVFVLSTPALANWTTQNSGAVTVATDTTAYNGGPSDGAVYNNGGTNNSNDLYPTGNSVTGASFTVSNNATWTLRDGNVRFGNYAGNTVTVNAGSTLSLQTYANPDSIGHFGSFTYYVPNPSQSYLYNDGGTFNLAGKIQFQPRNISNYTDSSTPSGPKNSSNMILLDNYGSFQVQGQSAMIERLANPAISPDPAGTNSFYANEVSTFGNWSTVSGSGKLTYLNSTGTTGAMSSMTLRNFSNAIIAPGTAGAVGTLELANMNVAFNSGGVMYIRLGGTSAGTFDVFTLSGTGATLDVSASSSTLNLSMVNGFTPHYGDSWRILNYSQMGGAFSYIELNSVVTSNFTLTDNGTYATLTYAPEPASLTLLGLGAISLLRRRKVQKHS